jgi:hypothetical protein
MDLAIHAKTDAEYKRHRALIDNLLKSMNDRDQALRQAYQSTRNRLRDSWRAHD